MAFARAESLNVALPRGTMGMMAVNQPECRQVEKTVAL